MGTRSTITFYERHDEKQIPLVKIYQHFDGYISGVGHELAKWLQSKTLVNGLPPSVHHNMANGIGCLVAQFIHDFKTDPGGLYITSMSDIEEYNYHVFVDEYPFDPILAADVTEIQVIDWNDNELFRGSPQELLNFKEK